MKIIKKLGTRCASAAARIKKLLASGPPKEAKEPAHPKKRAAKPINEKKSHLRLVVKNNPKDIRVKKKA